MLLGRRENTLQGWPSAEQAWEDYLLVNIKQGQKPDSQMDLNCASIPYCVISGILLGVLEPQFSHPESRNTTPTTLIYREDAYTAWSQVPGSY